MGPFLQTFHRQLNEMLSLQAFQTNFYQINVDSFKKVEEKDEIIKQYVVKTSDLLSRVGANKPMEDRSSSSIPAEQFATNVRPFQVFPVKEGQKNMVIGSSIVRNLGRDRSKPTDIGIHAYQGSTTPEKLEHIKAYPEQK